MKALFLSVLIWGLAACESSQLKELGQVLVSQGQNTRPTAGEINLGLKQALKVGAEQASNQLSKQGGFFKNEAIKILFPAEFQKAEDTLRKIGLGSICDQAIQSFNNAAEKASSKAFPILAKAITQMSFADAMDILKGDKDAATQYLIKTSRSELFSTFRPVVKESAEKVHATKYWDQVASKYNSIPFVKPIPSDISNYITDKALDGLFFVVKEEEGKIRENPIARTTELLKKVFGWNSQQG